MFQDCYGKGRKVNTFNSQSWQEISIDFPPTVSSQSVIYRLLTTGWTITKNNEITLLQQHSHTSYIITIIVVRNTFIQELLLNIIWLCFIVP